MGTVIQVDGGRAPQQREQNVYGPSQGLQGRWGKAWYTRQAGAGGSELRRMQSQEMLFHCKVRK